MASSFGRAAPRRHLLTVDGATPSIMAMSLPAMPPSERPRNTGLTSIASGAQAPVGSISGAPDTIASSIISNTPACSIFAQAESASTILCV